MTDRKKFRDLATRTMTSSSRARSAARTREMLAGLPLLELRRARELSQAQLARALDTTQPEVSEIESRADMYVSTLRSYIEAMGGTLDIVASFPDGDVHISQFHEVGATP
ncbi:MAG: XRE family transcriptional regulator [Polaromonas sp.]|nr:XRE family transcriptional regulator [Gemmatimonadaceae bacterium]